VGPLGFTEGEWRIVLPLSFAAFFENYDYALLSVAAPVLSSGLGVSPSRFGVAVSLIRLAGLAAIVLVRFADRIGRRRMLLITLAGFAAFTGLTAAAWGLISFIVISAFSRVFLTAEGAMSGLVISEEVDPTRRGRAVSFAGLIGQTSFGAVAIMVAIHSVLPGGWRFLYLIALGPLLVVGGLRRNLPETNAFQVAQVDQRVRHTVLPRLAREWWVRTAICSLVFGAVGAFQTAAAYHSAQLAQHTYHWTGLYTIIVVTSGPFTLAGFIAGGRGSDHFGRRPMLSIGIVTEAAGMAILFLGGRGWFAPGWMVFVFGQAVIAGSWLAFVSELVPTEVRATVGSIVVSVQVAAGSAGLALSSLLGDSPRASGRIVAWIGAASVALLVIFWALPETSGRDMVAAY
jgi:MFS family permease